MLMKISKVFAFTLLFILTLNYVGNAQHHQKYFIVGYVGAFGQPIDVNAIDAKKMTHINYAFVNCIDSMAVFDNPKNDTTNLKLLNGLKKINPDLKVLISIGGGTRSRFFSDAVLTPTSRRLFAKSSIDIVRRFDLDGIDVDWEYPGQRGGNNNVFREVDQENFTLMWKELRRQLNQLGQVTGKKYVLSGAFNVSKAYTDHVNLEDVVKYMDFINLMTYDFSGPNRTIGHSTNLYGYGSLGPRSADKGIQDYIRMGVPPGKLLIGAILGSRSYRATTKENQGIGFPRARLPQGVTIPGGGFTTLKDSLINKHGYKRYWDKEAQAPYLFNSNNLNFITYDDEESVKLKCQYAKDHHLAGIFFWQYFRDPKEYLLKVMYKEMK